MCLRFLNDPLEKCVGVEDLPLEENALFDWPGGLDEEIDFSAQIRNLPVDFPVVFFLFFKF